jgi:hypothetical protein
MLIMKIYWHNTNTIKNTEGLTDHSVDLGVEVNTEDNKYIYRIIWFLVFVCHRVFHQTREHVS